VWGRIDLESQRRDHIDELHGGFVSELRCLFRSEG
jgi:hypothetical protein